MSTSKFNLDQSESRVLAGRRVGSALHRLAAAATAGLAVISPAADAAVQYSGLLDIQVNHATPTGIYIDVDSLIAGTL